MKVGVSYGFKGFRLEATGQNTLKCGDTEIDYANPALDVNPMVLLKGMIVSLHRVLDEAEEKKYPLKSFLCEACPSLKKCIKEEGERIAEYYDVRLSGTL